MEFWTQKKWYNEKTGKLTPAGENSYQEGIEKEKAKKLNATPIYNKNFKIVGESDSGKAVKIEAKINNGIEDKEVSFYVPKSTVSDKDGVVGVSLSMLEDKVRELSDKHGTMSGKPDRETDKAYGFNVTVEDYHTEQEVNRMIWIPKSQANIDNEGNVHAPKWMFDRKVEEQVNGLKTGAYQYVNLGVGHKLSPSEVIFKGLNNQFEKSITDNNTSTSKLYADCILTNKFGKILFLKRSWSDSFGAWEYGLPGGTVEFGESIKDALIREVKEETSIDVKNAFFLKEYDNGNNTKSFYFISNEGDSGFIVLDNSEHDNYIWVNKEEAQELQMIGELKQRINEML